MKILDEIFRIIVAQTYSASDAEDLQAIRQRAINKLMGYLVFPIIAVIGLVMLLSHWLVDGGTRDIAKSPWQVLGALAFVIVYVAVSRRYREQPLSLKNSAPVSPKDKQYLWRFRCAAVGSFILVLLIPVVKHLASK